MHLVLYSALSLVGFRKAFHTTHCCIDLDNTVLLCGRREDDVATARESGLSVRAKDAIAALILRGLGKGTKDGKLQKTYN